MPQSAGICTGVAVKGRSFGITTIRYSLDVPDTLTELNLGMHSPSLPVKGRNMTVVGGQCKMSRVE